MKQVFELPEINVVYLEKYDIICTSCSGSNITSNPGQCEAFDN